MTLKSGNPFFYLSDKVNFVNLNGKGCFEKGSFYLRIQREFFRILGTLDKDKMYIKKYWYNYIGGTDDSLTLVDYLYDKGKTEIPLSEIFNDTGLSKLNWNFHISPNLEYIDSEGQCHEFYYAIDLATDLAALILESKKSGGFNIKNLFDGEKRDRFVKIITTPEEDQAMNRALAEFCASPLEYDLHEW